MSLGRELCPLVALTTKGAGEPRTGKSPPRPSLVERSEGGTSSQQNPRGALFEEDSWCHLQQRTEVLREKSWKTTVPLVLSSPFPNLCKALTQENSTHSTIHHQKRIWHSLDKRYYKKERWKWETKLTVRKKEDLPESMSCNIKIIIIELQKSNIKFRNLTEQLWLQRKIIKWKYENWGNRHDSKMK